MKSLDLVTWKQKCWSNIRHHFIASCAPFLPPWTTISGDKAYAKFQISFDSSLQSNDSKWLDTYDSGTSLVKMVSVRNRPVMNIIRYERNVTNRCFERWPSKILNPILCYIIMCLVHWNATQHCFHSFGFKGTGSRPVTPEKRSGRKS